MPEVTPVKALYSPHIQFSSVGWLRAALLYWEGILRFVPDGFAPFDPPEVHELVSTGLIENVSADRYRKVAGERFGQRIEEIRRAPLRPPCLRASDDPLIHVSLIERSILQDLERRGLAASGGEWVKMSPEFAALYKVILADTAGRELNAPPTTDETACEAPVLFEYRKVARGTAHPAPPDGFACARRLHPFPMLESSASFSTESLLKARSSFSSQRRIFRETVQERVAQIADLPSEEAIESHLRDFETEIEAELHVQRGALLASNLRDAGRLLLISAPASIGTAFAVAESVPLVAAAGVIGSIGLGITDVMMRANQRKRAGNYLLLLEAAFGNRRLAAGGRDLRPRMNNSPAGRTSGS
jgi:hypothetical protein